MKADKEALAAKEVASLGETIPETPEVPDAEGMKDAAEEMVEDAKEAGEAGAFNLRWKAKFVVMKDLITSKLSCCTGGAEETKSALI